MDHNNNNNHMIKPNTKYLLILIDFCLINVSFFIANYIKRGHFILNTEYRYLLFIFYSIWFLSLLMSNKYRLKRPHHLSEGLQPVYRSFLYMVVWLFFIIFILKLFYYSRLIILTSLLIYFFLVIFAYILFYLYQWGPSVNGIEENNNHIDVTSNVETKEDICIDQRGREIKESLKSKLSDSCLNHYHMSREFSKLYDFIDSAIYLDGINASESLMLDANTDSSVNGVLSLNSGLEFIGNLHKLNNIQRINKFFISVNQKLTRGGYFAGVVETLEQRLRRKFSKYPKRLRKYLCLLDFIWTRIFPRLPTLKNIYFMIHGKDRRVISRSEALGRLYFCGFDLVKMEEIDNKLYFLTRRVRIPLADNNPSYGPIFKQKRIGLNGEIIHTYKFRTMHPYSEYIHKYMYDQNGLNSTGKINNDIRIPNWGHFMRKNWIDELPMLINLLQGDLKLVGLRPISASFFRIYPEGLKKERIKHKPGLIPALYADMPHSTEEIWESERKYMENYEKHPLKTDFSYFFKVAKNIIFNGAKSA